VDRARILTYIGPNGPLPKELLEMYPDAPLIKRNGEGKQRFYPMSSKFGLDFIAGAKAAAFRHSNSAAALEQEN
jgi:hypothetical protein